MNSEKRKLIIEDQQNSPCGENGPLDCSVKSSQSDQQNSQKKDNLSDKPDQKQEEEEKKGESSDNMSFDDSLLDELCPDDEASADANSYEK